MRKRLLSILLAVVMISALMTGCSSNKAKTSTGDSSSATEGTKTEESIKLTYMTWANANIPNTLETFVKKAKEELNIEIELMNYPSDEYVNILLTKAASGDLPDLVEIHKVTTGEGKSLIEQELLADLSGMPIKDELQDVAYTEIEGKIYMYSNAQNPVGIFYNKQVFKDNGIEVPANIAEFYSVCDKLKAAGIIPIVAGYKDQWVANAIPWAVSAHFMPGSGNKVNETWKALGDGSLKFSSDGSLKTIGFQLDLRDRGYFQKNYMGTDSNQASTILAMGQAAMMINGSWMYSQISEANPDAEIGFIAIPVNQPGEDLVLGNDTANSIAVSKNSKNIEAAKQALALFLSEDIQKDFFKEFKGISTRKDFPADSVDVFTKEMMAMYEGAKGGYGAAFWTTYWPSSVATEARALFQEALADPSITAEDVAKKMDDMMAIELKK